MVDDVKPMSDSELRAEVVMLRTAISEDQHISGRNSWCGQSQLWCRVSEEHDRMPAYPDCLPFMLGCVRYRKRQEVVGSAGAHRDEEY